jgi:hypothetical protein
MWLVTVVVKKRFVSAVKGMGLKFLFVCMRSYEVHIEVRGRINTCYYWSNLIDVSLLSVSSKCIARM